MPRKEMIMSTIRSANNALDFHSEPKLPGLLRRLLTAAQTYRSAMVDGLAAVRTYHELTRRGATHEEAVEKVFNEHLRTR
jgi:hypothetical protein